MKPFLLLSLCFFFFFFRIGQTEQRPNNNNNNSDPHPHSNSNITATPDYVQKVLAGPKKVIYIDYRGINWSKPEQTVTAAVDGGFNVVILAFWIWGSGAADMALAWESVGDKKPTMDYVHSKGAIVLVSGGGSTDAPYAVTSGSEYGSRIAAWAHQNHLDGVDFDMENFGPGLQAPGLTVAQTIQWLVDASHAAKSSGLIVSHAPQSPFFGRIGGGGNPWTGTSGGYTAVYRSASDSIDFFNVQFYNQGASCYEDYRGIFLDAGNCKSFPGTSVREIAEYGVPVEKLVVGKPVTTSDASNGWVSGPNLGSFVRQARDDFGWNSGIMGWVWRDSSTGDWIRSIYG